MNRKQKRSSGKHNPRSTPQAKFGPPPAALARINELYAVAAQHHLANRLDEAKALYRKVVELDPRQAHAFYLLALIAREHGQGAVAADLIGQAITINPQIPEYHSDLGNTLKDIGRLEEAVACFERALALKPDYADAHNNLGAALQAQGKLDEAANCYERAVNIKPDYAQAYCNLGTVRQAQGRVVDALAGYRHVLRLDPSYAKVHSNIAVILYAQGLLTEALPYFERARALKPDDAEVHHHLGTVLQGLRKLNEAAACYDRALALNPKYAEAYNNLGAILYEQNRLEDATSCFRAALALKPDHAEAHNNLGSALVAQNQYESAAASYAQAVALRPDHVESVSNLGSALQRQGRLEEAVQCFERALAIKPDHASTHSHIGTMLSMLGRVDEARQAFETAIAFDPRKVNHYNGLVGVKKFKSGDPHLLAMEGMAQDIESLAVVDQIRLRFALGKAYDDIGDQERSFRYLLAGNAQKRHEIVYDEATTLALFDRLAAVFTPEWMAARCARGVGEPSNVPIFILGMPRSGSTLVEQILASHPQVFGAGECQEFNALSRALFSPDGSVVTPERIANVSDAALARLGADYVAALRAKAPQSPRITDKMPHNFLLAGLIHLALPNARIIHTQRDAVDTCLSCFSKAFGGDHPYAYDLAELGRYWRGYDRLMAHWRHVLPPGVMLEVRYDEMVNDQEGQTRRLLAHCNLEWDDACLSFTETTRAVRTASVTQVRQPIYKTSVGRWHAYAKQLQPLLEALEIKS